MATQPDIPQNFPTPEQLVKLDTRNVFGVQNIKGISATTRRRLRQLHGETEPLSSKAWKLINEGTSESLDEAKQILITCLPNPEQEIDERYFSIYWGLGRIAHAQGDVEQAIQEFVKAVKTYPQAVRNGHLYQLETLGLIKINQILRQGGNMSSTDAAALAHRLIPILSNAALWQHDTFGARLLKKNRRLET